MIWVMAVTNDEQHEGMFQIFQVTHKCQRGGTQRWREIDVKRVFERVKRRQEERTSVLMQMQMSRQFHCIAGCLGEIG